MKYHEEISTVKLINISIFWMCVCEREHLRPTCQQNQIYNISPLSMVIMLCISRILTVVVWLSNVPPQPHILMMALQLVVLF